MLFDEPDGQKRRKSAMLKTLYRRRRILLFWQGGIMKLPMLGWFVWMSATSFGAAVEDPLLRKWVSVPERIGE